MYASRYISLHPEKVAGAVLMEPGPLTRALYDEVRPRIFEIDLFSEWLNDYAWAQSIVSPDGHARADYLRALGYFAAAQPGYHQSTADRDPFWRLGAVVAGALIQPAWDFTQGLDRFPTQVLFEASSDNTVIGTAFQQRQMRFYGNARLEVIAGAGHDFPWTHAAPSVAKVFSYLESIGF